MPGPEGVRAGLEEALAEAEDLEPPEPRQAALFEELAAEETGALDAPSPLSAAIEPRKRGRPPGSRNRRTEAVVGWLLAQHRHPLLVMMEAYSMTPAELADRIGLKGEARDLLEVFKLQMRMAEAVAPYLAQRQPQAVQIDTKGALYLAFEGVSLPARREAGGPAELAEGLRLPFKSDDPGRTDGQVIENAEGRT